MFYRSCERAVAGVSSDAVRFMPVRRRRPLDVSSHALERRHLISLNEVGERKHAQKPLRCSSMTSMKLLNVLGSSSLCPSRMWVFMVFDRRE